MAPDDPPPGDPAHPLPSLVARPHRFHACASLRAPGAFYSDFCRANGYYNPKNLQKRGIRRKAFSRSKKRRFPTNAWSGPGHGHLGSAPSVAEVRPPSAKKFLQNWGSRTRGMVLLVFAKSSCRNEENKQHDASCFCKKFLQNHRPGSSVPELSLSVKSVPELASSQHLSASLQRLYRYFATVMRSVATSR
jgi:hypothetical protein